jgi:hypothetical protein
VPRGSGHQRLQQAGEISHLQERWKHATGHMPTQRQFQVWLSEYSMQQLRSAFDKLVKKHQESAMEPAHQLNYVTCILRSK